MEANVGTLDVSEDLVEQFCAVTGADSVIGRQLLEICHGNLEMAIGMHMDQEPGERTQAHGASNEPRAGSSSGSSANNSSAGPSRFVPGQRQRFHRSVSSELGAAATVEDEDLSENGLRAPIPQRHEVLVEDAPKIGFRGRRRTARSVFDGFRDFQAEARQQESMLVSGRAVGKKNTLEDLFRPPIDITFKGSFHAARDRGKGENKWLMVNIQNVQEFACQVLNRDIWSGPAVKALIKKHFVFWQVYHDSEEGKKFMQFYSVSKWPHVAIVDPVTGENLVTWDKIDGLTFADILRDFLEDHPSPENPDTPPPAKRQKRESSIVDESEEAQIEAAIRASLNSPSSLPGATTPAASSCSTTSTRSFRSAAAVNSTTSTVNMDPEPLDNNNDDDDDDDDDGLEPSDVEGEADSDDLETFTGSEEESRDSATLNARTTSQPRSSSNNNYSAGSGSGGRERNTANSSSSSQPLRNFSSVSGSTQGHVGGGGRTGSFGGGGGGRGGASNNWAAAGAAAGGVAFSSSRASPVVVDGGGGIPSTSSSAGGGRLLRRVVVVEDSENENSLGLQGGSGSPSHTHTPTSLDMLSSARSCEFHTLDSSASSLSGPSELDMLDDDSTSQDRVKSQSDSQTVGDFSSRSKSDSNLTGGSQSSSSSSHPWRVHFGQDSDPMTNLVVRFPDGKKEQLSLPCSSTLQALFVFCQTRGFGQDSFELVVNFPRRSLSSMDPSTTLTQATLHPQETVFVQAR